MKSPADSKSAIVKPNIKASADIKNNVNDKTKSELRNNPDTSISLTLPPDIEYLSIYDIPSQKHIIELTRLDTTMFPLDSLHNDNMITIQRAKKGRLNTDEIRTREAIKKQFNWVHIVTKTQVLISSLSYAKNIKNNQFITKELGKFINEAMNQLDKKNIEKQINIIVGTFFKEDVLKINENNKLNRIEMMINDIKTTLVTGQEQLHQLDARGHQMTRDTRELNSNANELAQRATDTNKAMSIILIVVATILILLLIVVIVVIGLKKRHTGPESRQLFQDLSITGVKIARKLMKSKSKNLNGLHSKWLL